MKKILFVLLTFLQFNLTISFAQNNFKISGSINGDYSDYIFLTYGKIKDSIKVINNKFEFSGFVEKPVLGHFNLRPDANVAWVWVENSNIEITGDYKRTVNLDNNKPLNVYIINDVKGSHSELIQKDFRSFYRANMENSNFNKLLYEKLQVFLKENGTHPYSGQILANIVSNNPILGRSEFAYLYSLIDTTQQEKFDIETFKSSFNILNTYNIGLPFYKFSLPNVDGKDININSYSGKITLVDFWASWCGPCREKHPELVRLKNELKGENFDIISISIDDDKTKWLRAIEKDRLTWTNLLDKQKTVINELGIISIPSNYLIDQNGNILGKNLSIEKIEKLVSSK
jgi:thiol-disulfide isomerase/thioredoxin